MSMAALKFDRVVRILARLDRINKQVDWANETNTNEVMLG